MKKLIFLIALLLFLIACHSTPRKPDLVANGKEFRFREIIVRIYFNEQVRNRNRKAIIN